MACSKPLDTQQAQFKVPNTDVVVSMSVATTADKEDVKERNISASEGGKQLFSANLKEGLDGKVKAKLYKKDKDVYLLVDNNGDRYDLNFRDKRFEKTDAATPTSHYVGKFDFDKQRNWQFFNGKKPSTQENALSTASNGNNNQHRPFGPPSKNF